MNGKRKRKSAKDQCVQSVAGLNLEHIDFVAMIVVMFSERGGNRSTSIMVV